MAIVRQISLQSDAFFKAMESHEELHVNIFIVAVDFFQRYYFVRIFVCCCFYFPPDLSENDAVVKL